MQEMMAMGRGLLTERVAGRGVLISLISYLFWALIGHLARPSLPYKSLTLGFQDFQFSVTGSLEKNFFRARTKFREWKFDFPIPSPDGQAMEITFRIASSLFEYEKTGIPHACQGCRGRHERVSPVGEYTTCSRGGMVLLRPNFLSSGGGVLWTMSEGHRPTYGDMSNPGSGALIIVRIPGFDPSHGNPGESKKGALEVVGLRGGACI